MILSRSVSACAFPVLSPTLLKPVKSRQHGATWLGGDESHRAVACLTGTANIGTVNLRRGDAALPLSFEHNRHARAVFVNGDGHEEQSGSGDLKQHASECRSVLATRQEAKYG